MSERTASVPAGLVVTRAGEQGRSPLQPGHLAADAPDTHQRAAPGPVAPPMRKDRSMIGLTRTNGDPCRLHPAEIQRVETHPCTLVYLTDGTKYAVVEEIDEITRRVAESRARGMAAVYRMLDSSTVSPTPARPVEPATVLPLRSRQER